MTNSNAVLYEYEGELLSVCQLAAKCTPPLSRVGMYKRLRKYGNAYDAVNACHGSGKGKRRIVRLNYNGENLTIKELAQMCQPPISYSGMRWRIKKHGNAYDAVHQTPRMIASGGHPAANAMRQGGKIYYKYNDDYMTIKELSEKCQPPVSVGAMRRRLRICGDAKMAINGSWRRRKVRLYKHNGLEFTAAELAKQCDPPVTASEMRKRLKKTSSVFDAIHGDLSVAKSTGSSGYMTRIDELISNGTIRPEEQEWCRHIRSRLLNKPERKSLDVVDIIKLGRLQNWRCALSGVELKKEVKSGFCAENISIDRINPGGPYEIWNIRLVCRAVNQWRGILPTESYVHFCQKVSENSFVLKGVSNKCLENTEITAKVSLTQSTTTMPPRSKRIIA